MSAEKTGDKIVSGKYKATGEDGGLQYIIVLVEKNAETNVTRGENAGRKLRHINIVRDFQISKDEAGEINFELPTQSKEDFFVAVIAQELKTVR